MWELLRDQRAGYGLVGLFALAVYANSLGNSFHYDDGHSIVDNPNIRDIGRVPGYFVDPTAFSAKPENAMYRPLLLTTFAFNHALGGYDVVGYHLVSLALHIGCAVLVGMMARQLLGDAASGLFAAGFFALHPIHTEPVNYISSRSEILAVFFVLLATVWYMREERRLWVCLAFAAGLLSKSVAVVLPGLLLVYELAVRRRLPADRGLFAMLAAIAALYVLGVRSFLLKATLVEPVRPFSEQVWTQVKAMVFYLKMLFWPSGQSVDHQFLLSDTLFDPIAGSAALFLLSLLWIAYVHRREQGLMLFALLWFFIALAPASLVPLNVLVNEHRLYLPGAALALVGARVLLGARRRWGGGMAGGVGVLLLGACAWATVERNAVWRDDYALWGDAAAKAPLMARPQIYLGNAMLRDGRTEEAVAAFEHVVRRDPDFAPAYALLGGLYIEQQRHGRAIELLARGLERFAADPDLWGRMAEAQRGNGDWQQSLVAYQRAVELAPEDVALLNNLGNTYQILGQAAPALAAHERALALLPDDAETLLNLGNVHMMFEDFDRALSYYRRAVDQRGDYAGAWFNLGYAHERRAEIDQARAAYDRAALDPEYAAQVVARRQALEERP